MAEYSIAWLFDKTAEISNNTQRRLARVLGRQAEPRKFKSGGKPSQPRVYGVEEPVGVAVGVSVAVAVGVTVGVSVAVAVRVAVGLADVLGVAVAG